MPTADVKKEARTAKSRRATRTTPSKVSPPFLAVGNKIETVTNHLAERISSMEWEANGSLPPQGQLSREYGVSPGTIALALRNLQQKRLVNIVSNKGAFVLGDSAGIHQERDYPLVGLRGSYVSSIGGGGGTLVNGIVEVANMEHCPLLLLPRPRDGSDYDLQYYHARGIQGAIFLGGESHREAMQLRASGFPVILANKPIQSTPLNYIDYDHKKALRQIIDLFVKSGHQRIGIIFPQTSVPGFYDALLPEFLAALASHGLSCNVEDSWRCIDLGAADHGAETVRQLLSRPNPPTALFALSHTIMSLIFSVSKNLGLRIPEDLSVAASCYNSESVAMASGFVLPWMKLGECLFHELYATIKNPFHGIQKLLPLTFVDRQTIAPARK